MPQSTLPTRLSQRMVAKMPWLDPIAAKLHAAFDPWLGQKSPRGLRDVLYGVWLGHPLHPAVVVVPAGMWTASIALDAIGEEAAADTTLLIGLVGAGAAAATGAAQWQDLQNLEQARRLGTLHATLNVAATFCYGASYVQRRRGNRGSGVTLAAAGFGLVNVSSWLGGDLAYDLGIGVNRTAFEQGPDKWTDVLEDGDLPEKTAKRVDIDGTPVMLYRLDGEVLALSPTCSHLGGPLDEGAFDGDTVTCPWHTSVFCLRDGAVVHGPATTPQAVYDVRVENGKIAVRAREP